MCIRDSLPVVLFSKHLHWADFDTCAVVLREIGAEGIDLTAVSYTHLRAHETVLDLVCRLLLEKKKRTKYHSYDR
mgnify:CR=1 FL=1